MKNFWSNHKILWGIIIGLVIVIVVGGGWRWRDYNSSWIVIVKRKRADILQAANNLYDKGEYKKAKRVFEQLIFLRDSYPSIVSEAWYRIGHCEYYLKKYSSARGTFKTYLNRYENKNLGSYGSFRQARLFMAKAYIKQENKDYEQAYLDFDALAVEGITSSIQEEAMYYAAYSLNRLKAYDEALGRYTEFLTQFPHSKFVLDAYFDKGNIYANKKDYNLALTNYELALRCTNSQNRESEIQLQIGNTYYNQRNFEKAFKVYNELLETYPESEQVLYARRVRADIYKRKKQWDAAIEEYKKIGDYIGNSKVVVNVPSGFDRKDMPLFLSPSENSKSVNVLGDDGFLRSVDLMPLSYYEIGKISAEKKDFEEAFKWYAKIIKDYRTDPIVPSALYNAMKALNALRDSGELEREVQSELCEILDLKLEDLEELEKEAVLKRFSDKYIAYLRVPKTLWLLKALIGGLLSVEGKDVRVEHNVVDYLKIRYPGERGTEAELELCEILEKRPEDIRKLKIKEVLLEHFAFHPFLSKNEAKLQNALLAAETQLKFADIKREELEDYTGAATEYAKLVNYPQMPHPRVDLLKLQGKYYEAHCHEKESASDKSVGAYQEVIRLFEATFLPLIDTPNIDMPHLTEAQFGYCIQTARYYVGNAYFATNQFDKAIDTFGEFMKKADIENEKVKEQVKTARDKIEEARRKLVTKTERPRSSSDASQNPDSSEKSRSAKNLTPRQKIAQIARESTVLLTMEYSDGKKIPKGTGFFVRSDLLATNYHVIEGAIGGTARLVGEKQMSYAIVGYTAIDPDRDLAILKVRAFSVKHLPLGDSKNVDPGEAVYPIGNPLGLVNVVSDGQISSIQWVDSIREFLNGRSKWVSDVQRENTPHKLLMMTAPISGGNSGGPVLNNDKEVIGVSVGSTVGRLEHYSVIDKEGNKVKPERYVLVLSHNAQNLNFAVPVNYLRALLKRTGPTKPLSDLVVVN